MLSYEAACWATLSHFLSYAVPLWTALNLLSNAALYWAAGHFTELCCTLLSYTVPTKLRCAHWAKVHHAELYSTLTELRCTLLSYAALYWAMLNPTELCWTLLSYAVPYWAKMFSTKLSSTMWATLQYSLTELPSVLIPACNSVNAGLQGWAKLVWNLTF